MVDKISNNFSGLFAELKCAGDVVLHVPDKEVSLFVHVSMIVLIVSIDSLQEDFGQYGIKIRVKFRDTEPLQELSAHRHSGGERSVSTVVYMMALQEMTSCPFRCVDEINQVSSLINLTRCFQSCILNNKAYFEC